MNSSLKTPPPPVPAPPSSKHTGWWVFAVIVALAAGGYYFYAKKKSDAPTVAATPTPGRGGGGRGGRFGGGGPVPISSAVASSGELRVYLSALGSVSALNTITVKSRADGELKKIHFTEGQLVKAGDLLAEIDPRSYQVALEQAQGQLARDTAQLDNAKHDLERYQNAREAVTQQQVDAAASQVAQYAGAVRADQGSVANYQLQLSYCRVTAPIAGRVGLRLVDQGNLVRSGDSSGIVVIAQEEPIAVVFSIPEDNLPQIRKALAKGEELPVEAYDRSLQTKLAQGTLVAVDNQIDATTGTVKLKATFLNDDHGLFPNQFVNVRMLTEVQGNVILVPNSAVQIGATSRFVFIAKADDTVERRNVTIGRTEGEKTVILTGVAAGETVVTEGLDRLQDGAKIAPRVVPTVKPGADGTGEGARRGQRKRPQ